LERFNAAGHEAYIVGGCVRDALLDRDPNDWDITTSARPEETAACFADQRTVETGLKHGTLTVLMEGMPLEITTFRSDGVYEDHRHPVCVTFSTHIEEDLSRRDFTVNAMAYHPTRGLVDLFGGREDLQARRIACVGEPERRFDEDGLRILRAIRFASVLDFEVDPRTAEAVHGCRHLLTYIAPERIREELCKLITGVGSVRILREYADVIGLFLPELGACVGFAQNTKYHCYDVYEHILQALSHTDSRDLITRLAILFHDIGKPDCYTEDERGGHFYGHGERSAEITRELMRRLRFDNATADAVTRLVKYHDCPIPAEEKGLKRWMQRLSDEDLLRLLEIQRCDRLACAPDYSTPDPSLAQIPGMLQRLRKENACVSLKDLQVKGTDLMELGIPAGKAMGRLLAALLEDVLDGTLPNQRSALLESATKRWDLYQNEIADIQNKKSVLDNSQ